MDAFETIFTRRSVRQFTAQVVEDNDIQQILKAAMSAPSAVGKKPWHFIVIKDKNLLAKIPKIHHNAQMTATANLAIIPCADPALAHKDFWSLDLAASCQNILLAVRALNLGAVWCGIYPNEDRVIAFRELLKIPSKIVPICIIPIGHTEVEQTAKDCFIDDRIHHDCW